VVNGIKRDFLALEDWSLEETEELLSQATRIKRGEITGGLEKKVLALFSPGPALSDRTSFETAMFLHGGHTIVVEPGPGDWSTETGSLVQVDSVLHLIEAARVLGRYAHAVALRSISPSTQWSVVRQDTLLKTFAQHCPQPVINLESARRHPCQALADGFTLREKMGQLTGKRFVLTWAWHPRALSTAVPASAALIAARLGMEIVIARPEGYELDPEDTALIRRTAQQAGGEFLHINNDPDDALVGADAVYVSSWGAVKLYGKPDQEADVRAGLRDWKLTAARLRSTRGGKGLVMHSLPVHRNVEIEDRVLDGPNSVVVDQAENRMHVQRALLLELIGNRRGR
jgi:N-acetylornithine carbamoyltransferase